MQWINDSQASASHVGLGVGLGIGLAAISYSIFRLQAEVPPKARKRLACVVKHPPVQRSDAAGRPAFDHSLWTKVLQKYVQSGEIRGCRGHLVHYPGLVVGDQDFETYLLLLANAHDVCTWSSNEQLAFYINVYNALCLNHVVQYKRRFPQGPALHFLHQIPIRLGLQCKIWDMVAGTVAGKPCSLGEIEHTILRGTWNEPRVHAALNCASVSCPDLRKEAFEASRIHEQVRAEYTNHICCSQLTLFCTFHSWMSRQGIGSPTK
jgi:hypothetical protein